MQMQWVILLIGIGTVFAGLFIIQLIIMLFKVTIAPKTAKRDTARASEAATPTARQAGVAGIDGALVAAISAAIAHASGMSVSSFRIASIEAGSAQAGGFNTPAWGYIDRVARTVRGRL